MAEEISNECVKRLGLFPTYKAPKYLGEDKEFAYFEFRVPRLLYLDTGEYHDEDGVLPEGWMLDMIELPVHTGLKIKKLDKTFIYYECKVPLFVMKSWMGMGYFAPQMEISDRMPPPNPDQERNLDKIFKKAKAEGDKRYRQYAMTFQCNGCMLKQTEIHINPTSGLMWRYCGSCGSTVLHLVEYKGVGEPIKLGGDGEPV